jgi:hypothetical protein
MDTHHTPMGTEQRFQYALFRREASERTGS